MSNILFLSQLLPYPPDAGPKFRSYYVLRQLAQNHRITLLAFSRPDDTLQAINHLQELCEEVHLINIHRSLFRNIYDLGMSLLTGKSFIIQRDILPEMELQIETLLKTKPFDVIHADQLWMAHYALYGKKIVPSIKLLIDEHNACFQVWQRLAVREHNPVKRLFLEYEWRKLRHYEANACSDFDQIVTVTKEDKIAIDGLINSKLDRGNVKNHPTVDFSTIPICVDTKLVDPVLPIQPATDILHLGTMYWMPNIEGVLWFVHQVWPKVVAKLSGAKLVIGGKNPPHAIRELSKSNNRESFIKVIGYIPDPTPYLQSAGVFIVPLLSGGGMRVKIIDAWRWGLPIVSTSIGAEGILHKPGENILIADDEDEFANAVIRVLQEPELAMKLRKNGRQWVEEKYDYRLIYPKWEEIYSSFSKN